MIDQAIAILLILYPLVVFLGRGCTIFMYSFLILLIAKLFIEKFYFGKLIRILILSIIVISLIIKNYLGILGESDYFNSTTLNLNSITMYAITMIVIMLIMYIFPDIDRLKDIYSIIYKYNLIILFEVIISQIIIGYKFITGSAYTVGNGVRFFNGTYTSSSPHPFAYAMIFMVIIVEWVYIIRKNSILLILNIVPLLTSIISGARVPTGAIIIIFISIRLFKNKRQKFINPLISLVGIISIILFTLIFYKNIIQFIFNSAFIQKFITSAKTSDVTSGRDIFWQLCFNAFNSDFNILQKLLGRGIFYTVLINKKGYNMAIWAHQDFLDILISYGLIFLIIYAFLYIRFFYKLSVNSSNKMMLIGLFLGFILLSSLNGIVNYPFFVGVFCYISIFIITLNNLYKGTLAIENHNY
jgi:hypothetical protein